MSITEAALRARHDFAASEAAVARALDVALASDEALVRFLGAWVSWNGHFGSGVATLAGRISRMRRLFLDPDEAIPACADRSVHVAGYFFDAARDEFDDGATPHRDSHRSLAQATLKGVLEAFGLMERGKALLREPAWLQVVNEEVHRGYGVGAPEDREALFAGMGFHLGSEILADAEFSLLDARLRRERPALVERLLETRVHVAGADHPAYYWIGVHSGLGGGVEVDHFAWAVRGLEEALRTTPAPLRPACEAAALVGFDRFAACHGRFFRALA